MCSPVSLCINSVQKATIIISARLNQWWICSFSGCGTTIPSCDGKSQQNRNSTTTISQLLHSSAVPADPPQHWTPAVEQRIMLQTRTKAANKLIWAKLIYLQISYLPFFPVAIPLLQADCHFNHDFHNIFIKWLHMFPKLALSREWYKKPFWKEYDPGENLSILCGRWADAISFAAQ